MASKGSLLSKSYSVSNYLLIVVLISWIALRVLFFIRPDSEWTGFIGNRDIVYILDSIPLSWFHGFYLYELNIGLLRAIVIIAILIVGLHWVLSRKKPGFVFSPRQKILYKTAVGIVILSLLALIGYIITLFVLLPYSMRDWEL